MKAKIDQLFHRKNFRIWIMVISLILSLIAFEEVVDDTFSDPKEGDLEAESFDRNVSQFFFAYRTPVLDQIMTDFTALGSVSVVSTLFIILISLLFVYRDFRGIFYLTVVFLGGGLWPLYLKTIFARARPLDAHHLVRVTDLSFPSGHTFGSTCAYLALAFYAAKFAKRGLHELFFFLLGALIGFLVCVSRIYLGVHYPTDVLGGLTSGFAWVMLVSLIFKLYQQKRAGAVSLQEKE